MVSGSATREINPEFRGDRPVSSALDAKFVLCSWQKTEKTIIKIVNRGTNGMRGGLASLGEQGESLLNVIVT
jgi:hypothetical protein